jgi:hypothetical protein
MLDDALNTDDLVGDQNIKTILKDLREFRGQRAAQLYPEAEAVLLTDPEIIEFMRRPDVQRFYNRLRENRILNKAPDVPPDISDIANTGVPTGALDKVQQAVRTAARKGASDPDGIDADAADALLKRHAQILDRADALNPAYQKARKAYADDSDVIDALIAGGKIRLEGRAAKAAKLYHKDMPVFASAPVEEVRDWVIGMKTKAMFGDDLAMQKLEAYLLCAYGSLRRDLQKSANPLAVLAKPETLEKIKILAGNQPYTKLVQAFRAEALTRNATPLMSSPGIPQDVGNAFDDAANLILAGAGGALGHAFAAMSAFKRVVGGDGYMTPETAAHVMEQLVKGADGNPDELVKSMGLIKLAKEAQTERQLVRRLAGAAATAPIATRAVKREE